MLHTNSISYLTLYGALIFSNALWCAHIYTSGVQMFTMIVDFSEEELFFLPFLYICRHVFTIFSTINWLLINTFSHFITFNIVSQRQNYYGQYPFGAVNWCQYDHQDHTPYLSRGFMTISLVLHSLCLFRWNGTFQATN